MTSTITLNQFPVATQANTGDTLYLSQSGIDKQVPVQVLLASFINFQNLLYSSLGAGQIGTMNGSTLQANLTALLNGQGSGVIGYATFSLMNADLAHSAGTVALVTNDATVANNTFYLKSGSSGSGSWTAQSTAPLTLETSARIQGDINTSNLIRISIEASQNLMRNLYDSNRSQSGLYVDTTGGLSANAGYYASNFIACDPSTAYVFRGTGVSHIAYYDLNQLFISYAGGPSSITTPSNAAYLRFSHTNSSQLTMMLVPGSTAPNIFIAFAAVDSATAKRTALAASLDAIDRTGASVRNLFDPLRTTQNTLLDLYGNTYAQSGYFVTDYIPVQPSTMYSTSAGSPASGASYYDENKVFISSFTASTGSGFTTPANCFYFRQGIYGTGSTAFVCIAKGASVPAIFPPFASSYVAEARNLIASRNAVNAALPLIRNLFDQNRILVNTAISNVNGATYAATGWFTTPQIPVTPLGLFYSTQTSLTGAYFDINGKFLSGFTSLSAQPATVPADAYYVQFQSYGVNGAASLVVTSGGVPSGYIQFVSGGNSLPWQGKNLLILGDSISANGLYVPYLIAGTGMNLYANYGVAGRAVRQMGANTSGATLTSSDLSTVDFVSILGGTNDYGGSRSLGTIADAYTGTSAATFYADVFNLLTLLYTLKPTVRVMFSTPMQRGAFTGQPTYPAANSAGYYLPQYVQAIKDVCTLFSTPVCDLFSLSGINTLNLTSFTADNLHPNAAGSILHSRPMIAVTNAS